MGRFRLNHVSCFEHLAGSEMGKIRPPDENKS